ncbi:MAG: ParB/RepB/Spo0J family partition protein [Proteobacteria bacterium]|nr:ParB/RepB/Spo0J family partition protein [Pseudomonadota bacterium]
MVRKNLKFEINPLLSGPSLEARTKSGSPYRLLPLSEIDVDPDQPRRSFEPEALSELAASIKEYGVLSPVLVRVTAGGTFRLIAGERRYRASKLLGLDTIPAIIDTEDSEEKSILAKQLVENIQRQDLASMEKATAISQLKDKYNWSIREIAKHLGTSKSMVQRSLDIFELPEDLKTALVNGASESKVLILSKIDSREMRQELLEQLDELSRSALELRVSEILEPNRESKSQVSHGGTKKTPVKSLSGEDKRIIEETQRALGAKVQIVRSSTKPGQGKLVVEFYSNEDLRELHKKLINS